MVVFDKGVFRLEDPQFKLSSETDFKLGDTWPNNKTT